MLSFKHTVHRSVIVSSLTILSMAMMTLGTRPVEAGPFAYVTNAASVPVLVDNTVTVIDTASNALVDAIHIGQMPRGVAISPHGKFVYVTNGVNTVSVIATASNTVVKTIPVGLVPIGVAITGDGRFVYVANSQSNTVSVIARASNTVVRTIPVGKKPQGVAITPNGQFVYVVDFLRERRRFLRRSGQSWRSPPPATRWWGSIPVGVAPLGAAISPHGEIRRRDEIDKSSNASSAIATASNTVVKTIPIMGLEFFPCNGVAMGPNGNYAYVTDTENGTVLAIDRASNTVVQTITVGSSPIGVATTGDGKFVYVANDGSNSVSVIAKGPGQPPSYTVVDTINGVGVLPLSVAIARQ